MTVLVCQWARGAPSVPPAQQWLTGLLEEAHRSRHVSAKHHAVLTKLKTSFAVQHMSTQAYGKAYEALKPEARQAYLRLMEIFFEKAVLKALFHAQAGEEKIAYRVFPIKAPQASECAASVVGEIDYEQRVDWTIQKAKAEEEVYETKFCIRKKSKNAFEIVDVVVEGVSWVKDLADEIQRFYQEAQTAEKKLPPEKIHGDLVKKIQDRIQKLDEGAQAGQS